MELFNLALRSEIDSASQIAVMMVLSSAADDDGVCWPSVDHLVDTTRLGRSTVLRALSELESDGYITKQRRRAKSSVYTVVKDRFSVRTSQSETSRSETSQSETLGGPNVSERDLGKSRSGTVLKRTTIRTTNTSAKAADTSNPEAQKLCERLAELMVDNGCKRPDIGKRWLDAARLLLTREERPFTAALAVLEWSQADDFESANIHSMPKFRARYDQLRLKAQKAGALTVKATTPTTVEGVTEWLRKCWADAAVRPIEQAAGLRYEQPDLPLDVTSKAAAADYFRDHRRDWISQHHAAIVAKLTRSAA